MHSNDNNQQVRITVHNKLSNLLNLCLQKYKNKKIKLNYKHFIKELNIIESTIPATLHKAGYG